MAIMRFAVLNTVPPGFCRKMRLLAPSGRLDDLAQLTRDDLPRAGLSPTHMEAIQGFAEWRSHGVTPVLGLVMWYFETIQADDGSFLRTHDAPYPSLGVAIRYLQLAGELGLTRDDCEAVDRTANWLESEISDDGLLHMPVSGLTDYGMLARAIRSLVDLTPASTLSPSVDRACEALRSVRLPFCAWPTYPGGEPSAGATSLAINAFARCPAEHRPALDTSWLLGARNRDGGWGEYADSPSRIDNTFWSYRACCATGNQPEGPIKAGHLVDDGNNYDQAMAQRLAVVQNRPSLAVHRITEAALKSCTEQSDRYAEAALYAIALGETLTRERAHDASAHDVVKLPARTPDFLRREPPLYDQLADVADYRRWISLVDHSARTRIAESMIGWFAGLSAGIAIIGDELIAGLSSLPALPLVLTLIVGTTLTVGWLAVRHNDRRRLNGLPHFAGAAILATLLVLMINSPPDVDMTTISALTLGLLLALIIDVVAVATDQADLLNRLGRE